MSSWAYVVVAKYSLCHRVRERPRVTGRLGQSVTAALSEAAVILPWITGVKELFTRSGQGVS
jgi:hypothetical protein